MRLIETPRATVLVESCGSENVSFKGPILKMVSFDTAAFTDEFRDWLFGIQDGEFGYCGELLGETWNSNPNAHVEHIKPRRLGGEDFPPNLMYACRSCNTSKGNDHFSSLLVKRALKKTGLGDVISHRVASRLLTMGALNMEMDSEFHFERENWSHVLPLPCPAEHATLLAEFAERKNAKRLSGFQKGAKPSGIQAGELDGLADIGED